VVGIVLLVFAILGGTALVLMMHGGEAFEMEWEEIDANAPLKETIEESFLSIQEIFFITVCFALFLLFTRKLEDLDKKDLSK